MKYFALLTKLGENLLAQATALGTKLELTHMSVGDGGGALPTPDTNQTKLIAEKRRAAINTLFINEKNKNQIVAEQIIPESEGGWWIREIGLFDKAGNLIAIANCPETYKPQLAEGSGRTQSIRIVLIVSHTESVTLKIDPSVVLATRDYVNTEITVVDKKIDALSAQTKLDLNKKFDKANISSQKGNDNDKVPSLSLFTGEIGKLAAIGYSYSKTESDNKYATNTALNNGLALKLDKTGGTIAGSLIIKDKIGARLRLVSSDDNSNYIAFHNNDSTDNSNRTAIIGYGDNNTTSFRITNEKTKTTLTLDESGLGVLGRGSVVHVGDFGIGSIVGERVPNNDYNNIKKSGFFAGIGGATGANIPPKTTYGDVRYGGALAAFRSQQEGFILLAHQYEIMLRTFENGSWRDYVSLLTEKNTRTDRNGYLRSSSSTVEIEGIPIGGSIIWNTSAPIPSNFWPNEGRSFSASDYPELAKVFPSLKLPDDRGYAIRAADNGRGKDPGRTVGTYQEDQIQNIEGEFGEATGESSVTSSGAFEAKYISGSRAAGAGGGRISVKFNAGNVVRAGSETRMKNVSKILITRVK
ncbi:MAG: phage tail protein [Providencia sp.]|uniref:phage tail protein n=1 Tax=Providencia sp. TaxID=589 RepID=UPI003F98B55F